MEASKTLAAVPVTELLPGLELKGDLLPWQDLSPLADVVGVIGARPVRVGDGVGAAAVRQRHSEVEKGTPDGCIQALSSKATCSEFLCTSLRR